MTQSPNEVANTFPKPLCSIGPAHLDGLIKLLDSLVKMGNIHTIDIRNSQSTFLWKGLILHIDFNKLLGKGVNMSFYIRSNRLSTLSSARAEGKFEVWDDTPNGRYLISTGMIPPVSLNYAPPMEPEVLPVPSGVKWGLPVQSLSKISAFRQQMLRHSGRLQVLLLTDGTICLGHGGDDHSRQGIAISLWSYRFLKVPGRKVTSVSAFCCGGEYFLETETRLGAYMKITSYESLWLS